MRRIATVVVVSALLVIGSAGPIGAAKTPRLDLTISNFRFCQAETCTPVDVGYLRTSDGPAGLDNPAAAIDVKRGTIVYWIYQDGFCDTLGCPGHNVVFENGSASGVRKGFVAGGGTGKAIKVKITQKAGTTIRYFCSVNNHYETGMTGILNVV
jgi:plastocyanin